jgi:hypothetical protein
MQSVPITTKVVSSNPVHGQVYSTQLYVLKFVNDLRQVCGFLVNQKSKMAINAGQRFITGPYDEMNVFLFSLSKTRNLINQLVLIRNSRWLTAWPQNNPCMIGVSKNTF